MMTCVCILQQFAKCLTCKVNPTSLLFDFSEVNSSTFIHRIEVDSGKLFSYAATSKRTYISRMSQTPRNRSSLFGDLLRGWKTLQLDGPNLAHFLVAITRAISAPSRSSFTVIFEVFRSVTNVARTALNARPGLRFKTNKTNLS